MMSEIKRFTILTAVITAFLINCAAAASTSEDSAVQAEGDTPVIAPKAEQLLRDMGDYLKAVDQFSFHAEITYDHLLPTEQKVQFSASGNVEVRRPDRIHAEVEGDLDTKRFWYDGKTITLLNVNERVYASEPVPSQIDAALDHVMEKFGFSPPLADLVYSDPYASFIPNVEFGFYVGLHNVEETRCHHLAFVEKYIDWQIWIEDGKELVPRKLLITYKTLPGGPQYTAVLSDWDLSARLPDRLFTADIPEGMGIDKIEFMMQPKHPATRQKDQSDEK